MLFSWINFIIILSFSIQCWSYHILSNSTQPGYLRRIIRQATTCKPFERQCLSGRCIPRSDFCDGIVNCPDGSDETLSSCANTACPSYAFQCAYGACVSGDAKCDKNKDCVDNSDETLPECNSDDKILAAQCSGKNQVPCNDGTCISKYSVCDGIPDCPDSSDETFARCNNVSCGRQYFQCQYGACVDGDAPCNGIRECADNSDESQALCKSTVNVSPGGEKQSGCILPPIPKNGIYTVNERSNFIPGDTVAGIIRLDFVCQKGFELNGISDISCSQNNKWNRPIPECLKTCSPRVSTTLDIKCTRNDLPVDCTKPVLPGTQAVVKCKQFYKFPPDQSGPPSPYDKLVCEDGTWDYNLLPCIPVCGKKNAKGIPNIIGGNITKLGEYPWHVGVYRKINILNRLTYNQICGGSIINPKVIITAAHCFETTDPSDFGVAAGKFYRKWNDPKDTLAQPREVEKLYIPSIYKGLQHNYANDIAIVVVDKPFEFSNVVNPVCVEWSGNTDKQTLIDGSIGYVAGWGLEQEAGENSIELKHLKLPFVPYDTCFADSPVEFRPIVGLSDKICAGRTDGQSVCTGDSGGGLTFQIGEIFYLTGIVSIGPDKAGSCDSSKYTTFTLVSYHAEWANNITRFNTPR